MKFIKNYLNRVDVNNYGKYFKYIFYCGGFKIVFELGKIAKQANNSVWIKSENTIILVTLCFSEHSKELDFLPLTCDYIEKSYSIGKIPGGFVKKETKQSDKEILISRIIDRSVRPMLCSEKNSCEIQILSILLSYDYEVCTESLSVLGASLLIFISGLYLNFFSPVSCFKSCYLQNGYILFNPPSKFLDTSVLNLIISLYNKNISMIEFCGKEILPEVLLKIIKVLEDYSLKFSDFCFLIKKDNNFIRDNNYQNNILFELNDYIVENILIKNKLINIYKINNKDLKNTNMNNLELICLSELEIFISDIYEKIDYSYLRIIKKKIYKVKKNIFRDLITKLKTRLDGRKYYYIRDIEIENGLLSRSHGSALFTRGETQALVITTIGTEKDEQKTDDIEKEDYKKTMLQYNFYPFSVGEVRSNKSFSRREIGHGALSEKSIYKVLETKNLKNTVRIVSEILESNGSSSMATVCGSCISVKNSGLLITRDVVGLAVGAFSGYNETILLDISGEEDHFGDMDFKFCSTNKGIVSIQMDIKNKGIDYKFFSNVIYESKIGIKFLLNKIKDGELKNNKIISYFSPIIIEIRIGINKIKDIIGVGGKTIKNIINKFNVEIDIYDDGIIKIFGKSENLINKSLNFIMKIIISLEKNRIYISKFKKSFKQDVVLEINENIFGYCNIFEFLDEITNKISDNFSINHQLPIFISNIEEDKIKLSRIKSLDFNCDFKYVNYY